MFDPTAHLIDLKGKDYLPVAWRLVWLRTEHADAIISTSLHTVSDQAAIFSAHITIPNGGSATGWGSETIKDFRDYVEKAETKAIGRALAALGYGTQFCEDFDFNGPTNDKVVDSPVVKPQPRQATAPAQPKATPTPAATPTSTRTNNEPIPIHGTQPPDQQDPWDDTSPEWVDQWTRIEELLEQDGSNRAEFNRWFMQTYKVTPDKATLDQLLDCEDKLVNFRNLRAMRNRVAKANPSH